MGCGASTKKYQAKTPEELDQAKSESEGLVKPIVITTTVDGASESMAVEREAKEVVDALANCAEEGRVVPLQKPSSIEQSHEESNPRETRIEAAEGQSQVLPEEQSVGFREEDQTPEGIIRAAEQQVEAPKMAQGVEEREETQALEEGVETLGAQLEAPRTERGAEAPEEKAYLEEGIEEQAEALEAEQSAEAHRENEIDEERIDAAEEQLEALESPRLAEIVIG